MSDQQINSTSQAQEVLSSDPMVGTVFESRFEILSVLGSGGSATAYKANDVLLLRPVALKIIHSFLLSEGKSVERFMREAKTCTVLEHKNIAKVYASGVAADGRPYMVMDLLDGKTLSQVIKDSGPLSLDRFFSVFRQLIDALVYAHSQKVVHRDLKPSNILITDLGGNEQAILVDFGIAKIIDQETGQSSTQTGALLGSTAYMSPEQCVGAHIDERSDIYSFACVMIEALTGKAPYEGDSAFNIMYKHLNESIGHLGFLKEMPDAVSAMLGKCLQKKPEARYQSMLELKEDFDKCALLDTSQRQWKRPGLPARKVNLLLLIVPVLLVGGIITFICLNNNPPQRKGAELSSVLPKRKERREEPAKDVLPPQNPHLLSERLQKYPDIPDKIVILNNWLRKWDSLPPPEEMPFVKADVRYVLADNYRKVNELDKALSTAREAVKIDASRPDPEPSKPILVAQILRQQLKPTEALAYLTDLRKRYGAEFDQPRYYDESSLCYGLEGECWQDLGEFGKAENCFKLAASVGDKKSDGIYAYQDGFRYHRIQCLIRLGNRDDEIRRIVNIELPKSCNKEVTLVDQYLRAIDYCSANGRKDLALEFVEKAENAGVATKNDKMLQVANWREQLQIQNVDPTTQYRNALAASERAPNFVNKVLVLNNAALALSLRDPERARRLSDRMIHLMRRQLTVNPDFFWKNSSPYLAGLIGVRCDFLINAGDAKGALQECQFWISTCRGHVCENLVGLYENESKCYGYLNDPNAALASNQKALSLLQHDPTVRAEMKRNNFTQVQIRISGTCAQRISIFNSLGRWADSEAIARVALNALAPDPNAAQNKSSMFGLLGSILEQEKKYDEAEKAFKSMLSWISFDGRPWANGTAYEIKLYTNYLLRQKRFEEAEKYAQLALSHSKAASPGDDMQPIFRAFWLDLGTVYTKLGKPDLAMSYYQKIDETSLKNNLIDHLYRGGLLGSANVYCAKGEYDRAIPLLKKFLATAPTNLRAANYQWLANCYMKIHKQDERFSALKKAVKIGRELGDKSPEQKERLKELAVLYKDRGQDLEANLLLSESQSLSSR